MRCLDKRETIDVTYVCFTATSKHVKSAYVLLKLTANLARHFFLCMIEVDRIADLFASGLVSLHFSIDGGASSGFSMRVFFSNRVNFNVEAVSW